jgi:putative ABC transport system permease protein
MTSFDLLTTAASFADAALYNSIGFFVVALGVLVSIRFAGFPDLTIDGSFTIGAGVYAVLLSHGSPVVLAWISSLLAGAAAGVLTATVNQKFGLGKIISGVLIMLLLILLVPYITSGATIGLLTSVHWLSALRQWDQELTRTLFGPTGFSLHFGLILLGTGLATAAALSVIRFFRSRTGVGIRYIGSAASPGLLPQSKSTQLTFIGLSMGNGLVGLGGALEAERNGGFNQHMGVGVLLVGLAIVLLGESVIRAKVRRESLYVTESVFAVVIGVILYSFGLQMILALGLAVDVKLASTLLLFVLLAYSARRYPSSARLF